MFADCFQVTTGKSTRRPDIRPHAGNCCFMSSLNHFTYNLVLEQGGVSSPLFISELWWLFLHSHLILQMLGSDLLCHWHAVLGIWSVRPLRPIAIKLVSVIWILPEWAVMFHFVSLFSVQSSKWRCNNICIDIPSSPEGPAWEKWPSVVFLCFRRLQLSFLSPEVSDNLN